MFSFQGDFKRQRNINLGGNRRNDPKRSNAQATLLKAQEERQKREVERHRQRAALTIQKFWRGTRATELWRQHMRETWDFWQINKQQDRAMTYARLADFAAYFNRCSQEDIASLCRVLEWLFGNSSLEYRHIIGAESAAGLPSEQEWAVLLAWLLKSAMAVPAADLPADDIVPKSLLSACLTGTGSRTERQVLRNLIQHKGLYEYLVGYISGPDRRSSSNGVGIAAQLLVLPFGVGGMQELAVPKFTRSVMGVPGLPNRIGVHGVTTFTKSRIPWAGVASQVQAIMEREHEEIKRLPTGAFAAAASSDTVWQASLLATSMLGNLTAFLLPHIAREKTVSVLSESFVRACAACARLIPNGELFEVKTKHGSAAGKLAVAKSVDVNALRWLHSVFSVQILEMLVRACSSKVPSSIASEAQELLLVFIQRWGNTVRNAVLDNLLQAVDVRTVGWRSCIHDQLFLEHFAGDRVKIDTIRAHNLVSFQLLCEVLNHQLQTLGDDELFRQNMSLPVTDIKTIARVCRNIAFCLHWSQTTDGDLTRVRDTATDLTRQLFTRDTRHPFVEEGFWLVPPSLLDMSSFADRVVEDPAFDADPASLDDDDENDSDDESDSDEEMSSDSEDNSAGLAPAIGPRRSGRLDWLVSTYSGLARNQRQRTDSSMLAPRVAILRYIPFVVPFNDRVRLFHALVNKDRGRLGLGSLGSAIHASPMGMMAVARATVRRGSIFNDGFRALYPVLSGRPVHGMDDDPVAPRPRMSPAERFRQAMRTGFGSLDGVLGLDGEAADEEFEQQRSDEQVAEDPFGFDPVLPAPGTNPDSRLSRSDNFKRRMHIEFIDQYGMPEAGIDGGGVFKEFLTSLVREAFDPKLGLFNTTPQNNIYPSPSALDDAEQRILTLDKLRFLGAVIGKALYEGVLVDAPFALFFLIRWMNQLPGFNDLPTLDEDLYRGLVNLKNYPVGDATQQSDDDDSDEDEIYQVFGLDFTITGTTRNGKTRTVPLVPRGDRLKVTSQNRLLYVDLVAQYRLVKQIDAPVNAFVAGLHSVIPPVWLTLLFASPLELSHLLCGNANAIDIDDWKRNTVYEGAYKAAATKHPTIVNFWSVVEHDLTERQRSELCRFATSCERPPLLGFGELTPRFCIRSSDDGGENTGLILRPSEEQNARLPSASTCVNLLKLPIYSSRGVLREKLVTAIESGAGFDLS
ncbi:ubiquitin-protein ligase (E3) [Linderina pennispora]|nr:ubiquitin-protein ligase (E3) [Linderina pennispora]